MSGPRQLCVFLNRVVRLLRLGRMRWTVISTVARMPISPYIAGLRARVGHDLLMLPGVSAVVRNDRGQILLGRRSDDGSWGLPAGAIDPGEQPADAVVREIYEETGVVAEIERIGGVALNRAIYPNGDVCDYLDVWFALPRGQRRTTRQRRRIDRGRLVRSRRPARTRRPVEAENRHDPHCRCPGLVRQARRAASRAPPPSTRRYTGDERASRHVTTPAVASDYV